MVFQGCTLHQSSTFVRFRSFGYCQVQRLLSSSYCCRSCPILPRHSCLATLGDCWSWSTLCRQLASRSHRSRPGFPQFLPWRVSHCRWWVHKCLICQFLWSEVCSLQFSCWPWGQQCATPYQLVWLTWWPCCSRELRHCKNQSPWCSFCKRTGTEGSAYHKVFLLDFVRFQDSFSQVFHK